MRKPKLLITGGAGFIGSHMVKRLLKEHDYEIFVLDNLKQGHRDAVLSPNFIQADLADTEQIRKIFSEHSFDAVLHFAALISVAESMREPELYLQNNTINTLNLLDLMLEHGVKQFIFSSTAAIYGMPEYTPIDTNHPKAPINPYGASKWRVEQALQDYAKKGLRSISLRYFNAAGCDPDTELGDRHTPQTHLIPLIMLHLLGHRPNITVYGRDYDTPDGTCIRDYIHVSDLCEAHLLALTALEQGAETTAYNLGNGQGYSVQEVLNTVQTVTQKKLTIIEGERRLGDPDILIADASAAQRELGWKPRYPELRMIVEDAYKAFCKFY